MNPITHLLISWCAVNVVPLEKRDRAIAMVGGIIPDIDGIGALPQLLTRSSDTPLTWFSEYHHLLTHNIGTCLLGTIVAVAIAKRRLRTGAMFLLIFHLHLLCDIVGSRGPDGYQWPIPYLLPFSSAWQLTWSHQWQLNAWPNFLITIVSLGLTFWFAWKRGFSILELVSSRADRVFVETILKRI